MDIVTPNEQWIHPCLTCGACCASFRVAFYWREAEPREHASAVPGQFWEELTDQLRCMKGTSVKHNPKCVALQGQIGQRVGCSIYNNRPSPCRQFTASYENGEPNKRCDEARAKHGLRPLLRSVWKNMSISLRT